MRFRKSAHAVYKTEYHIVWTPRYRRAILVKGVKEYLEKTLQNLPDLVDDIEVNFSCRVERVLASRRDISDAIHTYYGVGAETVERLVEDMPLDAVATSVQELHDLESMAEDASVVRLVNQLLQQAI